MSFIQAYYDKGQYLGRPRWENSIGVCDTLLMTYLSYSTAESDPLLIHKVHSSELRDVFYLYKCKMSVCLCGTHPSNKCDENLVSFCAYALCRTFWSGCGGGGKFVAFQSCVLFILEGDKRNMLDLITGQRNDLNKLFM